MKKKISLFTLLFVVLLLVACASNQNTVVDVPVQEDEYEIQEEYAIPLSADEIDYDAVQWQSTPDSSVFTSIGYDSDQELLIVEFRDSGSEYAYFEYPEYEWNSFQSADSLGKYYNANIKGQYESEKLD